MPRKHSAQANPVPTDIRAPDFCKAKSSVSQCVNQKVLFWLQIIGCSDRSITCNPSGVAVERKAIIDSEKEVRTTQYVYQFNIVVRSAPPSPLVYFCIRLALLRYWHCEDEVAKAAEKEIISKHKGRSAACILSFSASLTLLYVWWIWIYSRSQNSPDVSSLRSKAMLLFLLRWLCLRQFLYRRMATFVNATSRILI